MASNPREAVFNALYVLLLTADYPFDIQNTDGRLMQSWEQYPAQKQPAMYLQEGPQKAEQNTAGGSMALNRWTYKATVWFYFRRDGSTLPATIFNGILDAIDAVLVPGKPPQPQTLAAQNNGIKLVTNVRITDAAWDEGFLDPTGGQAVVMVNLEVLTSN